MPRSKKRRIRILLVDDHPVVREGLRSILSSFDQITVAGEASSGQEALAVSRELKPDVIVMDINMPGMTGIEATSLLRRDLPDCKVLALSMYENRGYVAGAVRAGARGYLLKDSAPRDLVKAIAEVFRGGSPLSPQLAQAIGGAPGKLPAPQPLTPREIEVLIFLARGRSNKEISSRLGISVRTVETHRENLIRKTGHATVAELTRYAVNHGHMDLQTHK